MSSNKKWGGAVKISVSDATLAMKGQRLKARVKLANMRFPRSGHQPGEFAIATFRVIDIIEGSVPEEFKDGVILAKGNMPSLDMYTEYIFQGVLVIDSKWGPQYNVEQIRLDFNMKNPDEQRRFFRYFLTDRQIELLFQEYDDPVTLLENKNIAKLIKIKGIGEYTAKRMCSKYEDSKDYGRAYVELNDLELTKVAIDKLVSRYGSVDVVVDKIKSNPYILIREVKGYGWEKCDKMALAQGINPASKDRVIAYAQYYLDQEASNNGNSWILADSLISAVYEKCKPILGRTLQEYLLSVMGGPKKLQAAIDGTLKPTDYPLIYAQPKPDDPKTMIVGLFYIRVVERKIALNFQRLHDAPAQFNYDHLVCEQLISEAEKEQGFEYSPEQKEAIWTVLNNNVSIITGGAGTGKTTLLNAATKIFNYYKENISQCALSGRASSKMTEVTGVMGKTIHRLLGYIPDTDGFKYNKNNPISSDVIILDETSMVGGEIFLQLIEAIKSGSKFIMVGDFHQLEAIGMANILKDCLSSGGYIPSVVLSKIHRQAAKSGIITQSVLASTGKPLVKNDFNGTEIRGELRDFELICSDDQVMTQYNIIEAYKHLVFDLHIPVDQVQIIVPTRIRGAISCRELNNHIQNLVNPGSNLSDITVPIVDNGVKYEVTFKKKDRIIITRNNYHAKDPNGHEVPIFNGNVGFIKNINNERMTVVLLEQGDVVINRDDWGDVGLAYAITCHKKQGDQIPYAIIGLDNSAYTMLSREWVYTAITRASKYCILVGQPSALNTATKISRVRIKQTWLKEDLTGLFLESQKPVDNTVQ